MDACCLSRPFDDQTQNRVHIETEAINNIITLAKLYKWVIFSSEVIDFEMEKIPEGKNGTEQIKFYYSITNEFISLTPKSIKRAQHFQKLGIKLLDSYHLALAEENNADLFLTTDDNLLSKAQTVGLNLEIANPATWLTETSNGH
jgi:predicted nucleic acid-binding protein